MPERDFMLGCTIYNGIDHRVYEFRNGNEKKK
jgi:hypothetical protein